MKQKKYFSTAWRANAVARVIDGSKMAPMSLLDGFTVEYDDGIEQDKPKAMHSQSSVIRQDFDDKGRVTYREWSNGDWEATDFSSFDESIEFPDDKTLKREIRKECSNGRWTRETYDDKNQCVHLERSDGLKFDYEYDDNGVMTYCKSNKCGVQFDNRKRAELDSVSGKDVVDDVMSYHTDDSAFCFINPGEIGFYTVEPLHSSSSQVLLGYHSVPDPVTEKIESRYQHLSKDEAIAWLGDKQYRAICKGTYKPCGDTGYTFEFRDNDNKVHKMDLTIAPVYTLNIEHRDDLGRRLSLDCYGGVHSFSDGRSWSEEMRYGEDATGTVVMSLYHDSRNRWMRRNMLNDGSSVQFDVSDGGQFNQPIFAGSQIRLSQTVYDSGKFSQITYDSQGRPVLFEDNAFDVTTVEYDDKAHQKTIRKSNGEYSIYDISPDANETEIRSGFYRDNGEEVVLKDVTGLNNRKKTVPTSAQEIADAYENEHIGNGSFELS